MKATDTSVTLKVITNQLTKPGAPMFFSRFGDGDMFLIDGKKKERYHDNSLELQRELTEAIQIKHSCYLKGASVGYPLEPGMTDGVFAPFGYNTELMDIVKRVCPNEDLWLNPIVFHYLYVFKQDELIAWIMEHIWHKKKCFVGSVSRESIERFFGKLDHYIEVPERNAYKTIHEWYPKILDAIEDCEILIPCAGMATRVINKRLFKDQVNIKSIDIGSLVDALDKKPTRTWIKKTSL